MSPWHNAGSASSRTRPDHQLASAATVAEVPTRDDHPVIRHQPISQNDRPPDRQAARRAHLWRGLGRASRSCAAISVDALRVNAECATIR
jgi:hypothetical protein